MGLGPALSVSMLFHLRNPLGKRPLIMAQESGVVGTVGLSRIPIASFDIASSRMALSLLRGSGGNVRSFASARVLKSK